ncbi:MAG TPA: universal stress protein [Longimicrobiales bacterium]|nr:universal stress protein [Longimicrobiales bacterium]
MYDEIVVPLDGSTFAEAALPLAAALSKRTKAEVHLVTVMEPIPPYAYSEWEPAVEEQLRSYLDDMAAKLAQRTGGEVSRGVHSGPVVETLLREVELRKADLVVMATHGRGALSRAWLGSVADRFLRQASTPVLLVRPEERDVEEGTEAQAEPRVAFETILVPLDGTDLSESVLDHAIAFGELFGSAFHLTRVVTYPLDVASPYVPLTVPPARDLLAEAKADALGYLEDKAERMRRRGLRVTTSVAVDTQPGHGILAEAEAVGCDLVAMATHGRRGVGRLILGSAADKVLRGTRVPLLLYRPGAEGTLPPAA